MMTAPETRKAANAGERAAFQTTNNGANNTSISKNILAEHFCFCRPSVPCILCIEWNRTTCQGNVRPPDSLRCQTLSSVARTGG
jgi:hypothetical protein